MSSLMSDRGQEMLIALMIMADNDDDDNFDGYIFLGFRCSDSVSI